MNNKGFTLIEVLVSIAIIFILAGISTSVFYQKYRTVTVDKDVTNVISYLDKARNQTIDAVDASSFGISFSSTTVNLFEGTVSNSSTIKTTYTISPDVTMTYALTGGASQVYFNRLTGEPSVVGTITLTSKVNNSYTTTIVIRATGLAEVQ